MQPKRLTQWFEENGVDVRQPSNPPRSLAGFTVCTMQLMQQPSAVYSHLQWQLANVHWQH